MWPASSSAGIPSEKGEVQEKLAEDGRMSYGLKPRCESGGENPKHHVSHIPSPFSVIELLDFKQTYTARAKKVKPKLVYLQEIVLS